MKKPLIFTLVLLAAVLIAPSAWASIPMERTRRIRTPPSSPGSSPLRIAPPLPELTHTHSRDCARPDRAKLHIVCILDRSGSMQRLTKDTIGGYNGFIERQRAEAPAAVVTTVLFDNRLETLYENKPIADVPELTAKEYYARATTALLDAVGTAIMEQTGVCRAANRCPATEPAVFLIMTDGLENASREYSRAAVRKMVSDAQNNFGWQFIFMGANIDSVAEAGSLGISRDAAMDYDATGSGVKKAYERAGKAVNSYRTRGRVDSQWKE